MLQETLLLLFLFMKIVTSNKDIGFTYNGFINANLSLNGVAKITPKGLLELTNNTQQQIGHAFFPAPLPFKNSSNGNTTASFSSSFVCAIIQKDPILSGHGIAFVISPNDELLGALPSQYLGLFNPTNNGNSSNHVIAVELDTIISTEFGDIDDNHVGIDINSLRSTKSAHAAYFDDGELVNISLKSGNLMQVWVEYNNDNKQLNVTLCPIYKHKPNFPLLSLTVDLSSIILDDMFVGFSSSTGSMLTSHYILGWSFQMNGQAQALDLSSLPLPPRIRQTKTKSITLKIILPLISAFCLISIIAGAIFVVRKIKFSEILENWELEYGPHRFRYKELYIATKGFSEKELLGFGGFGRVYRGVLPSSSIEVAVKRISHDSSQGMREFIAEIASIGRIRHQNLVRLLGYCRRKGELLLIYDFLPHGSLDKLLFDQTMLTLSWSQRFHVLKGVASGLLFLHEEWVQVVLHRDVKASNVLLDSELNGSLGDFGLARLYDHGTDPQTTRMVGTIGYIAPELARNGKATTSTDVYAFGVFMLEVACGRRPLESRTSPEEIILLDWVLENWSRGSILDTADRRLGNEYVVEEMELVLKLGLLCSHSLASARPSMRQVMQFFDGDASLPDLSPEYFYSVVPAAGSSHCHVISPSPVVTKPLLSSGRSFCTSCKELNPSMLSV